MKDRSIKIADPIDFNTSPISSKEFPYVVYVKHLIPDEMRMTEYLDFQLDVDRQAAKVTKGIRKHSMAFFHTHLAICFKEEQDALMFTLKMHL